MNASRILRAAIGVISLAALVSVGLVAAPAHEVVASVPCTDCGGPPPALSGAHKIGYAVFWQSIDYASQHYNKCSSQLNRWRLDAMMLAVTWREPETTYSQPASPMTLSRGDYSEYFWRAGSTGPDHQAYWHPGIGIFQYDDAGLGSKFAQEKFETWNPSYDMAAVLSSRWCAKPGSYSYMWAPWFGCNNNACYNLYTAIYDSSTQQLKDVGTDSTVSELGGTQVHSCKFSASGSTFQCYWVNPAKAQGNTWWTYAGDTKHPLSKPFYVYRQVISGVTYEVRLWHRSDTGYSHNVSVRRPLGKNSRNSGSLTWYTSTAICDQSISARAC